MVPEAVLGLFAFARFSSRLAGLLRDCGKSSCNYEILRTELDGNRGRLQHPTADVQLFRYVESLRDIVKAPTIQFSFADGSLMQDLGFRGTTALGLEATSIARDKYFSLMISRPQAGLTGIVRLVPNQSSTAPKMPGAELVRQMLPIFKESRPISSNERWVVSTTKLRAFQALKQT
ncbi:hypothetical protein C8R45DRAFT_938721 [Mycena sanguinolenta]|nr:hypothetical protein C8R45DRAFT_938721 [Mycena sanguinolenta]